MPSSRSSRYTWDRRSLRFRAAATGRFVPEGRVFAELNKCVALSERRMVRAAERLQRGESSLAGFKDSMRGEIKSLHAAAAVVANGGLKQMDARRWGEVGASVRRELSYLNEFVSEIASGRLPLQSGRVRTRARAYAANTRAEFWATTVKRLREERVPAVARRRMGGVQSEHCPGCRREAARGWLPLDRLAPIGSQECRWFCKCSLELRRLSVARLAEDVVAAHYSVPGKEGSTFNLYVGDMRWRPAAAAAVFPERTRYVRGRRLDPERVKKYVRQNLDMLRDPRYSVGTWYNEELDRVELDVVATLEDKKLAEQLGRRYNQTAIYDLEKGELITTGGTGETPPDMPPPERRLPKRAR
jgi:hypothetical protein